MTEIHKTKNRNRYIQRSCVSNKNLFEIELFLYKYIYKEFYLAGTYTLR